MIQHSSRPWTSGNEGPWSLRDGKQGECAVTSAYGLESPGLSMGRGGQVEPSRPQVRARVQGENGTNCLKGDYERGEHSTERDIS